MESDVRELDLLDDVASVLGAAGRELLKRAPSALSGAAKGFMVGGPGGALLGGAMGAARPGMSRASRPTTTILTLLTTLLRPEVLQALYAIAAGEGTQSPISVAGVKVPAATFTGLIKTLAGQLTTEPPRGGNRAIPEYLVPLAEAGGDPYDPEDRAMALLALLVEADDEATGWYDDLDEGDDADDLDDLDELAESLDLAEIDRLGGID